MSEISASDLQFLQEYSSVSELNEQFRSRSLQQDFFPLKIFWLLKREAKLSSLLTVNTQDELLEQLYYDAQSLSKEKYPFVIKILRHYQDFFEQEDLSELLHYAEALEELEILPALSEPFRIPEQRDRAFREYELPGAISKLIFHVIDKEKPGFIYNPWGHIGQFFRSFPKGWTYKGLIPSEEQLMKTQFELIEYQIEGGVEFTPGDPHENSLYEPKDDQCLIAMPPIGRKSAKGNGKHWEQEEALRQAAEVVKAGGRAIVIVPAQVLLSRQKSILSLRESLVEEGLINSIIFTPARFWGRNSMRIDWSIIYMESNNDSEITLINGSKYQYVDEEDPEYSYNYGPELDENVLLEEWEKAQNRQTDFSSYRLKKLETRIRLIPNSEIKDSNYELHPPKYLLPHMEGVRIGDIARIAKTTNVKEVLNKRFVRIRDLKNSFHDYLLEPSTIKADFSSPGKLGLCKELSTSALLVASRWNALKPTYYVYKNESLFLSPDVFALELDVNTIDPQYLVYQLMQEQVTEQLKAYQIGVVVPTIRKQDLLNIRIPVPPLEEQRKILIQALGESESRLGQLFEKNLEQEKERWREELAAVEHNLRNGLSPLISGFSAIKKFLKSSEGEEVSLDNLISTKSQTTLGEFIDNQIRHVKDLNSRLGGLEQQLAPKSEELLNIDEIIQERKMSYEGKELYKIEYDYVRSSFLSEDLKEIPPLIRIGRSDFFELFDNVISNAEKHGFGQGFRAESGNIIKISVLYEPERQQVKLSMANNGRPLPDGMNHERIVKRLETSSSFGKGIGGAEIKRIVERYGGTFYISGYPVDKYSSFPFTVNYQFSFPLVIDSI